MLVTRFLSFSFLGFLLSLSDLESSPKLENESFQVFITPRKIPATTFEETIEVCGSEALILLSNGSQWIVQMGADGDEWMRGDRVIIKTADRDSSFDFILKNPRTMMKHEAVLNEDHSDMPFEYRIQTIDRDGYAILTNQGMIFTIGYFGSFTTTTWSPGDPLIIVNDGTSKRSFLMINTKDGSHAYGTLAFWRPMS